MDSPAPLFFCRQVAKIRQKKEKKNHWLQAVGGGNRRMEDLSFAIDAFFFPIFFLSIVQFCQHAFVTSYDVCYWLKDPPEILNEKQPSHSDFPKNLLVGFQVDQFSHLS